MAEIKKYIAVDLGAESGRVMLGSVSARKLVLEEIHRFTNGPIEEHGSLRWDFNRLESRCRLSGWPSTQRVPAHAVLVLDVSYIKEYRI